MPSGPANICGSTLSMRRPAGFTVMSTRAKRGVTASLMIMPYLDSGLLHSVRRPANPSGSRAPRRSPRRSWRALSRRMASVLTSTADPRLIVRAVDLQDQDTPSATSSAYALLAHLGRTEPRYREAAIKIMAWMAPKLEASPGGWPSFVASAAELGAPLGAAAQTPLLDSAAHVKATAHAKSDADHDQMVDYALNRFRVPRQCKPGLSRLSDSDDGQGSGQHAGQGRVSARNGIQAQVSFRGNFGLRGRGDPQDRTAEGQPRTRCGICRCKSRCKPAPTRFACRQRPSRCSLVRAEPASRGTASISMLALRA